MNDDMQPDHDQAGAEGPDLTPPPPMAPSADEVASAYGVPTGVAGTPDEIAAAAAEMAAEADRAEAAQRAAAAASGTSADTGPELMIDLDAISEADTPEFDDDEARLVDAELRAMDQGLSAGMLLLALEESVAQRDEYLDTAQRSRAEFDNFRRRSTREASAARQGGVGDLATKLLEVLDDLDRTAEVAAGSADEGLGQGVQAIHRKLVDVLMNAGIERVDQTEVQFDATRHEAVQQVPSSEPVTEPIVDTVLRPGYLLGERVLRAAMVVVRQ